MSQQLVQKTFGRARTMRGRALISSLPGVVLLVLAMLVPGSGLVRAQSDPPAIGSTARVSTADGKPLDLRAGPSLDQPIVAQLMPDEAVTVIAAPQMTGPTRWVPIKRADGVLGWVVGQYLVVSVVAEPVASLAPDVVQAEIPAPLLSPEPMTAAVPSTGPAAQQVGPTGPLEIEVKIKYPEAKGRHQEVTIWVTRNGAPVQDATVTMTIPDDEDQEVKILDPTNEEGRTYRDFTLGRNKGSVNMLFTAEAPDGGKGQTEASYFVR